MIRNPARLETLCKEFLGVEDISTDRIYDLQKGIEIDSFEAFKVINFFVSSNKMMKPKSLNRGEVCRVYRIIAFEFICTKYGPTYIVYTKSSGGHEVFWATKSLRRKIEIYMSEWEYVLFRGIRVLQSHPRFVISRFNSFGGIVYPSINFYN